MNELSNSMVQEPNSSNLVAEHAKAMQSILNCKAIIKRALSDYNIKNADKSGDSDPSRKNCDLLWILMPALINVQTILDSIIES